MEGSRLQLLYVSGRPANVEHSCLMPATCAANLLTAVNLAMNTAWLVATNRPAYTLYYTWHSARILRYDDLTVER